MERDGVAGSARGRARGPARRPSPSTRRRSRRELGAVVERLGRSRATSTSRCGSRSRARRSRPGSSNRSPRSARARRGAGRGGDFDASGRPARLNCRSAAKQARSAADLRGERTPARARALRTHERDDPSDAEHPPSRREDRRPPQRRRRAPPCRRLRRGHRAAGAARRRAGGWSGSASARRPRPGDVAEAIEADTALAIAVMRAANNGDGPSGRTGGVREAVEYLQPRRGPFARRPARDLRRARAARVAVSLRHERFRRHGRRGADRRRADRRDRPPAAAATSSPSPRCCTTSASW